MSIHISMHISIHVYVRTSFPTSVSLPMIFVLAEDSAIVAEMSKGRSPTSSERLVTEPPPGAQGRQECFTVYD